MAGALQALLMRKQSALSFTYLFNTSSTTTSHTVSSSAQAGDIAILHCSAQGSGSYTGGTPSGWTEATYSRTTSGTGAVWGIFAYKVLVSGDVGATLTGLPGGGQGQASTIVYYRPSKTINTVALGATAGNEATTGTPATQTQNVSGVNLPPNILLGGWIANAAVTTRSTTITMTEITEKTGNPYSYVKHKLYNVGDTLEYLTADMADYGNNCLQTFFLKFT